jgi:glycerol uptake facilitator protein
MYSLVQRGVAETVGSAALVLVGPGSAVATLVLASRAVPAMTEADLLGISFAFGFIVTALVYALRRVSGCHINPAITFAMALTRRLPWREAPVYWVAQYVGAVLGAFAIWAVFGRRAIGLGLGQATFDEGVTSYVSAGARELIGTGLLLLALMGIVEGRPPSQLAGLVLGGVVVGVILLLGPITGASLNPARALGPELVSAVASGPTHWSQYVPVYLLPGFVGAGLAALVYDWLDKPATAAV